MSVDKVTYRQINGTTVLLLVHRQAWSASLSRLFRFLQFSQCLGEESSSVLHKSNKSSAQRAIYTRIRETRRTCRIVFLDTLRRRVLRCSINGYRTKISKLVKPRLELQQQRKISCLCYSPRKNFGVRTGFQVSFEAFPWLC